MSTPNLIPMVDIKMAESALLKAEELMSALRCLNASPNENVYGIAMAQMEAVRSIASELRRAVDISAATITT